jgi:TGF-beta receptor, other
VDIDWPIKNWFQHHNYQHRIEIICKTCSVSDNDDEVPICWQNERQPFIVIDTYLRAMRRIKRSINCDAGITECCREHLYINFTDIGWNDW